MWGNAISLLSRWTQAFSITRTVCEFFSHVRARALALWTRLVRHKRGVQKKMPSSHGAKSLQSIQRVVWRDVLVIGCPISGSTFVWSSRSFSLNNLWFWARDFVYHLKLSHVLSAFWHVLLVAKSLQRGRCVSSCSPLPYFYSRISGRDSCKGGRFVTAPD